VGSLSEQHNKAVEAAVRGGLAAGHGLLPLVASQSMSPLIRSGDRVRVGQAEPGALRPGDIVLFAAVDGSLVTHRYIGSACVAGDTLLHTKGDRSLVPDTPWPAAGLVGRVEAILRGEKELDVGRGRGYLVHRLLALLMTRGGAWINRLPGDLTRRGGYRLVRWLAELLAWLAWFNPAR
jgi:signal peptidase I